MPEVDDNVEASQPRNFARAGEVNRMILTERTRQHEGMKMKTYSCG